jgi:Arc/MetJ family transcription regulator
VAKVTIEIDDGALAAAAEELGTVGVEEAVRAAIDVFADRHRRGAAFAELQQMAADGSIDLEFLQELHDAEKAAVARHTGKHTHGDPRAA